MEVQTSRRPGRGGDRLSTIHRGTTWACRIRSAALLFASTKFYRLRLVQETLHRPGVLVGQAACYIEFQAAFDQAQIYVNGTQVGQHTGGYNGFSIDITSAITTGRQCRGRSLEQQLECAAPAAHRRLTPSRAASIET
jgi:hypothetical protein